jgi:hypothetical protein
MLQDEGDVRAVMAREPSIAASATMAYIPN